MHIIHALLCRTTLTRQPSWHPYLPTQSLLPASVWQNHTTLISNSSQMCLPVLMSTSITLATGAVILHSTFLKIKPAKCSFLTSKCLDLGEEDDIGAGMWTYQSCTEMVLKLSDSVFLPSILLSGDAFLLRRHEWHVRGPGLGHGSVHQGLSTDLGGHP